MLVLLFSALSSPAQTNEQRTLVLVVGAAGEAEYGKQFSAWANLWKQAAMKGGLQTIVVGEDKDEGLAAAGQAIAVPKTCVVREPVRSDALGENAAGPVGRSRSGLGGFLGRAVIEHRHAMVGRLKSP